MPSASSARGARMRHAPARPATSRDSKTTSLRRKRRPPFSSKRTASEARDAVAPLGLARLVVLEVAKAHAVPRAVRLREERLGDRVARRPPFARRACGTRRRRGGRTRTRARRRAHRPRRREAGRRRLTRRARGEVDDREARPAREGVDREVRGDVPAARALGARGSRRGSSRPRRGAGPRSANETRRPALADGLAAPVPLEVPEEEERLGVLLPVRLEALERAGELLVRLGRLDLGVDLELLGPLLVVPGRRERGAQVLPEAPPTNAAASVRPRAAACPPNSSRVPRCHGRDALEERRPAEGAPAAARRTSPSIARGGDGPADAAAATRDAAIPRTPRCQPSEAGPASTTTASRAGSKLVSSRARTRLDEPSPARPGAPRWRASISSARISARAASAVVRSSRARAAWSIRPAAFSRGAIRNATSRVVGARPGGHARALEERGEARGARVREAGEAPGDEDAVLAR